MVLCHSLVGVLDFFCVLLKLISLFYRVGVYVILSSVSPHFVGVVVVGVGRSFCLVFPSHDPSAQSMLTLVKTDPKTDEYKNAKALIQVGCDYVRRTGGGDAC